MGLFSYFVVVGSIAILLQSHEIVVRAQLPDLSKITEGITGGATKNDDKKDDHVKPTRNPDKPGNGGDAVGAESPPKQKPAATTNSAVEAKDPSVEWLSDESWQFSSSEESDSTKGIRHAKNPTSEVTSEEASSEEVGSEEASSEEGTSEESSTESASSSVPKKSTEKQTEDEKSPFGSDLLEKLIPLLGNIPGQKS